jgi:hypothetical protein
MNSLVLETSTGFLVPAGRSAKLAAGGTQLLELSFLTAGVLGLLADPTAIALKAYAPEDLVTEVFSITDWTRNTDRDLYTASLNTLSGALTSVRRAVYMAKITYGASHSEWFHLRYGERATGNGGGTTQAPQPTGRVREITVAGYGSGAGELGDLDETSLAQGLYAVTVEGQPLMHWRLKPSNAANVQGTIQRGKHWATSGLTWISA